MIHGYIIRNKDKKCLTRNFLWGSLSEGFVFSLEEKEDILEMGATWDVKPHFVQHATFDEETQEVSAQGELLDISDRYLDFKPFTVTRPHCQHSFQMGMTRTQSPHVVKVEYLPHPKDAEPVPVVYMEDRHEYTNRN